MRLEELADPVTNDVVGDLLAEAGPLAPDAKTRKVKNWMATVADRIAELGPVDRARVRPHVVAALENVEWLHEVRWDRSVMPPYFKLVAAPRYDPAYVAPGSGSEGGDSGLRGGPPVPGHRKCRNRIPRPRLRCRLVGGYNIPLTPPKALSLLEIDPCPPLPRGVSS